MADAERKRCFCGFWWKQIYSSQSLPTLRITVTRNTKHWIVGFNGLLGEIKSILETLSIQHDNTNNYNYNNNNNCISVRLAGQRKSRTASILSFPRLLSLTTTLRWCRSSSLKCTTLTVTTTACKMQISWENWNAPWDRLALFAHWHLLLSSQSLFFMLLFLL